MMHLVILLEVESSQSPSTQSLFCNPFFSLSSSSRGAIGEKESLEDFQNVPHKGTHEGKTALEKYF